MLSAGSYTSEDNPPSPPDCVTVIPLPVPVAVPDSTSRAPSEAEMMLALTPGLFGAELIAEAMSASVLAVDGMLIEVEAPPTAMVKVPLPMVTSLCFGGDLRDLYVVTGSDGGPKENCATIFRMRLDVAGLPLPAARVTV